MINLLLGTPGGGKSYEAVVFHLLPAVQQGRKVVTNLPVFVDEICAVEPAARGLVEKRVTGKEGKGLPFATVDDYGDEWRHPASGIGPLYIIDEAHKVLPRASTPVPVAEWFAEHRHELCDVLLITQSYGKLCPDIRDLVQVCYRVKKRTVFGDSESYIRKVQDGIRGEVMSTIERRYEKRYFKLYKSHTRSVASAIEADAQDMPTPAFMKWKRAGWLFALAGLLVGGVTVWNATHKPAVTPAKAPLRPVLVSAGPQSSEAPTAAPVASAAVPESKGATSGKHPFRGMGIHVGGGISSGARFDYLFILSQNGQPVATQSYQDMKAAGYTVRFLSECVAELEHPELPEPFFARCDMPQTQVMTKKET